MHQCQRRFLRDRRLSAGREDGSHAADAGESCEGAEDDSEGRTAVDRSGDRQKRDADAVVAEVGPVVPQAPSSPRRKPGATPTGRSCGARCGLNSPNYLSWLWVPAVAGTTLLML